MDALPLLIEMLSERILRDFIFENVPYDRINLYFIGEQVGELYEFMKSAKFRVLPGDEKVALIKSVRLTAPEVGKFISEIARKQSSSSGSYDLVNDWYKIRLLIIGMLKASNYSQHTEGQIELNTRHTFNLYLKSFSAYRNKVENIKKLLLETTDSSNSITLNDEDSEVLFLMKAFPAFEHIPNFSYMLSSELVYLPHLICKACQGQPLALFLIGSLLSIKPMTYDTWNRVKDDLLKIKVLDMWHIFTYCYNDLPYFLQQCFLYLACYPIGYEIPATSLIEIWIAEGFVEDEEEETREETANKYLEQLVQRSLVFVSKKSFSGTIKICWVPRIIHEFAIKQSQMEMFLVANPDQQEIESLFRLAMHHTNEKQYTEVTNNHMRSFLAFNCDRNVLRSAVFLRVLALRNSAIPEKALPNMIRLRYLGLRGSNISKLPQNIEHMENLQTLDVRDTKIETLPESLWNISALCHVYVKPTPPIKGPPSTAKIKNLHILKTVAAHKSWAENIPHFLVHLRKFALSNRENLDWKYISNLLSHMDKLITMAIMGKFIPSEFVDTRAFPNLETVKSIKLEGQWICRKLFIDYVKFPPNLTKLTLTNSGLKEDPMPTLERLQALKSLTLQDGAYTGKHMVCSAWGFPQLQFLKLENLNLDKLETKKTTMLNLTTLRVVKCPKFNIPYNLLHVIDKVIEK